MKAGKSFFFVAVLAVLIGAGSAWADLTDGLISHWKLDGDANDSAGGNDGTLVNGPVWTTGQIGGALSLDGIDDYVSIPDSDVFDFGTGDFSISAWFKTTESVREQYIVDFFGSGNDPHIEIYTAYGGKVGTHLLPNYTRINGGYVADGKWHHVTITLDNGASGGYRLYLDGVNVGSKSYSGVLANWETISIAARDLGYGNAPFNGIIDDVMVFNRSLSGPEVEELYHGQLLSLEMVGPDVVAENFQAQYKAIANYERADVDVTDSADWSVEANDIASIEAGLLTTETIDLPQDLTIIAQYSEGENIQVAQKDVSIFAICLSGSALEFDGVDDYVATALDIDQSGSNDITMVAWVYPTTTTPYRQQVISTDNGGFDWSLLKRYGTWRVFTGDGSWNSGFSVDMDRWQHVAAVFKVDEDVIFYKNGVSHLRGSAPDTDISDNTVAFGDNPGWWYEYFEGKIDEVAIFDRALSAEEIRELMHTRPDTDEPNLVGYWDFDEGEGQVAYDLSPYGNDGQLGSTPDVDSSDPNWVESDAPVGICTLDGLVERNISNVLDLKLEILDLLDIALGKEDALLDYMDEAFHNGEYDNLNKGDVVKAKQKILSAIQQEEQAETAVDQSIEKLDDALSALDIELSTDGESQE